MKIKVDQEKCIGCGACVAICPEVFEIGPDGKSRVKNPNGKCDFKKAAESCPVGAIELS